MAWAGGNACEESAGVELIREMGIDLAVLVSCSDFTFEVLALLGFFLGVNCFLLVKLNVVVLQVPGSERCCVNKHNSVLHESLGTDELVVGRVVNSIDNASLASY